MTHIKFDISVIIPMYNSEKTILKAVRSVLEQDTHTLTYEILVVDDHSTDRSCDVINSFDSPNIRLIRQTKNRGTAHARNIGIDMARGEWIQFLDSDDELDNSLFSVFEKRKNEAANCFIYSMLALHYTYKLERRILLTNDKRSIGYFYTVWNYLIKREIVIPFKEEFRFEDVVFVFEMIKGNKVKPALLPNVKYRYNCMNSSSKMSNFNSTEYKKMFKYLYTFLKDSDRLTKMFFLETFVGIIRSKDIPLTISIPIAFRAFLGYYKYFMPVVFYGSRGHVKNFKTGYN